MLINWHFNIYEYDKCHDELSIKKYNLMARFGLLYWEKIPKMQRLGVIWTKTPFCELEQKELV